MRLRALAVTTALALAVTGLSACTSKVGDAAVVGGHGITEKDLTRYINPKGATPAGLASEQQQGAAIVPATLVLDTLIERQLFLSVLQKTSAGVPTAAQIRAEHDAVASSLSNGAATGAAFDNSIESQLVSFGFRASFAAVYIETQELGALVTKATKATSGPEFAAAIIKAKVGVSVSPRYGSWDNSQLTLTSTGSAGRPSFVTIGTDVPVAASPAAGQ